MAFIQKKKVEEKKVDSAAGESVDRYRFVDEMPKEEIENGQERNRFKVKFHVHKGANPDGSDYIHEVAESGGALRNPMDDLYDQMMARRAKAAEAAKEAEEEIKA